MTLTQSSPEPTSYLNLVHSDTEAGTDHPAPSAIRHPNEATSHLLRLVLDLQLDALLLTVAGSGIEAATVSPSVDQTPENLPWRRWAAEDSAVARGLCEETVRRDAALPSSLAQGIPTGDVGRVLEQLIARYSSMRDLLTEAVFGRPDERPTPAELVRAEETLAHYRIRLAELRDLRVPDPHQEPSGEPVGHSYLPGELLG